MVSMGALAAIGVAAGPAWAAGPSHLCEGLDHYCIYASGPNGVEMAAPTTSGLTNWTYADQNNTISIQQANVNLCLQLDFTNQLDPRVNGTSCVGDDAEKWKNVYDSNLGRTLFESSWTVDNGYGKYCLVGQAGATQLIAVSCNDSTTIQSMGWGTS
jgi:hypothetical protein